MLNDQNPINPTANDQKPENLTEFGVKDASFRSAGGSLGVIKLVEEFYQIMQTNPEFKELRALHHSDVKSSSDKLSTFLIGWLGGPRNYREKFGPISIPQAHQQIAVNEQTKEQWLDCMQLAIDQQSYSSKFNEYLMTQLRVPAERILAVQKR